GPNILKNRLPEELLSGPCPSRGYPKIVYTPPSGCTPSSIAVSDYKTQVIPFNDYGVLFWNTWILHLLCGLHSYILLKYQQPPPPPLQSA
ncbi:hypothetical protein SK128_017704, partial [Halocaridina rubra]